MYTCGDCLYFHPQNESKKEYKKNPHGLCQINPPVVILHPVRGYDTIFPFVNGLTDWCGQLDLTQKDEK